MIEEWIRTVLLALSLLFSVGTFSYNLFDRRNRATTKSIKELEDSVNHRFGEKCERLARLEGEVKAIPTREQFDRERDIARGELVRVHERIDELNKNSQNANLLLGQVLGELKQLNKGQSHG